MRQCAIARGVPPGKVTTILNGCDFSIFRPGDRPAARRKLGIALDAELVAYVGRISLPKGSAELTEAMIALSARIPDCKSR